MADTADTPATSKLIGQQILVILRNIRRLLQPSPRSSSNHATKGLLVSRPTAWLDGLRGFAAFLVFILHHEEYGHQVGHYIVLENPWNFNGQKHFTTFPLIRFFFTGGIFAVPIFFIISGYVLAYGPLQLVQAKEFGGLAKSTASSLFRRWGRLFLPVYVSTFIFMSSWYIFNTKSLAKDAPGLLESWAHELSRWWNNHTAGDFIGYNVHLWTIKEEFKGSIFVYCTILATSRFKTEARLLTALGLIAWRVYTASVDSLFLVGVLFCDLSLLAEAGRLPDFVQRLNPLARNQIIWYILFVLGMYLSAFSHGFVGAPEQFSTYPGWTVLHMLIPPGYGDFKFWYRFWGSIFFVTSIPRIAPCKWMLESKVAQYLGRVSYSFYLIHGPLLWMIGARMYAICGLTDRYTELKAWENIVRLPAGGPLGLEIQWIVPMLYMLILTLALSEIFTRFIDEPSIRFVHWIFSKGLETQEPTLLPKHETDPVPVPTQ